MFHCTLHSSGGGLRFGLLFLTAFLAIGDGDFDERDGAENTGVGPSTHWWYPSTLIKTLASGALSQTWPSNHTPFFNLRPNSIFGVAALFGKSPDG